MWSLAECGESITILAYWPRPFDQPVYLGVPPQVRLSALEAHRCVSVEAVGCDPRHLAQLPAPSPLPGT